MQDEDSQVQEQPAQSNVQEPLLPQSKVNHIIKQEKDRAFEKGIEHATKQIGFNNPEEINKFISNQVSEKVQNELNNFANEQAKQAFKKQIDTAYGNAISSVEAVQGKHKDFEDIKDSFKSILGSMPEVVLHANQFDNAGDILIELARHPLKALDIKKLSENKDSMPLAVQEMKKLSKSLMLNDNVNSVRNPVKPISNINPSSIGSSGDGDKRDWSKFFYG